MAVRVDRAGPVTTVILDRPEVRNAVDGPTAALLAEAFAHFEADPDAAVAVLCGAGGTFCAGADLKALGGPRANRAEPDGTAPMGPTRMRLSKPVIAAIAGHAVAGGLELALWCDLRVAEEDAVLGVFCRRWGVPLIDGGTVRLPQIVGLGRALDLHLIGVSGYRTPQHSVEVGGFADDPHTQGIASDTPGVEGVAEATLERFCLTRPFGGAREADHIQEL